MAILIFVTSTGITGIVAKAASPLTLHYASVSDTGEIAELKAGYYHGKVFYGIIDGEAAYCMNYGKAAHGGQSMEGSESVQTPLSDAQLNQLLFCMNYGHSRNSTAAPDNNDKNEFLATQAMVWIIEAGIFGTGADDSAAAKVCNSAPDPAASIAYYNTLKSNMQRAISQIVPSFTNKLISMANTIELEWNEANNRFEKTLTDSNGVLADYNISVSGVNVQVNGNEVTFYTSDIITTAKEATLTSNNGAVDITGSCLYWTVDNSSYQEFVSTKPNSDMVRAYVKIKTEELGYGELYKKDEATGVELEGAEYGIYNNKACSDLVEKITTNKDGYALSSALKPGTYYVKERNAPNKYVISDTVHTLVVRAGQITTIQATDKEQMGTLTIYKEGEVLSKWNGSDFIYETKRLPGATFKVTAGEVIYRADGTKAYAKGDLIAKNLVTGNDGSIVVENLHLGKYVVTETASIDGYTINTEPVTIEIKNKGQEVEISMESTSVYNSRQTAEINVVKQDVNTKVGLPNGEYSLYAANDIKNYNGTTIVQKDTLLQTIKTDSNGNGSYSTDLPINNGYYIKETKAPNNYFRNSSDTFHFTFSYLAETKSKAEFSYTFTNTHTTAKIALQKLDKELKANTPQGDATLKGAVYGLYARENISHPDGKSGILYRKDSLVTTLTTDDNGTAQVAGLYLGAYYVKEITPPEGYLLDEEEHDILCSYEGDLVSEIKREAILEDQVKKQPFQLIKAANNGETDAELLKGIGFSAYLVSSLPLKEDGTYDFDNAVPVAVGENGATEIFTNGNGYAISIPIPYGTYIVKETTPKHNYLPVRDFVVKITDHKPDQPQVWRILLDEEFNAKLQIIKKDSNTGRTVLVPNAEFKIYNIDSEEYVVQYTTYPTKVKHISFFTDEDGDLILPETLKIGNYRIEEVAAPVGYVVNEDYVTFSVDSDTFYEVDPDTYEAIIAVDYNDEPVVGELTIEKTGEFLEDYEGNWFSDSAEKEFIYREGNLAGAEFSVYAAEDIYTNDYQQDEFGERYKYYSEGELIATLITEEDGKATLSNLPLGSYKVVETKAPEGYVLNKEEQIITFAYADDKTPVIYESILFNNERQKVSLAIHKTDIETEFPIAGAEFSLYTAEDILNANDDIIIKEHTLLETVISGSDGMVTFTKDLPFGKYVAIESKVPAGYVSSDGIIEFDLNYQGQDVEVVELVSEFLNTPTTVEFTKMDITSGEELSGATLTVLDKEDNIVDTWTSQSDEAHIIKNLQVGETYTLREEFAPYGYLQAEDIIFTVEDTADIQRVEIKDEVPTGTIVINKDGEFLTDINLVKGKWWEILFDYFKDSLAGVTFEVYAAENITSPDGLDSIYYEKDQLITEIITNDRGYAFVKNLPLGSYYLIETKTVDGYVLDGTPIQAEINYVDQYTKVVYAEQSAHNERQKVQIKVTKIDADSEEMLEGAVFGLYALEEIQNKEGNTLVEKNTLIEKAVSGKEGTCTFVSDLPLGQYYVKEIAAPKGYVSSDKVVKIDATYQGEDKEVIEFEAIFRNKPTKVKISKTDITGDQELSGAKLTVINENGKIVESWTSGKSHLIEKLPVGKYTLCEESAPYGYTIANEIEFEVKDTCKIQKVTMKDEVTKGKVVIQKLDNNSKKPIAGVEFEIRDVDGNVLETLITDSNGFAESKAYFIGTYENGGFGEPIKYNVIETKAADGYILDEKSHEVVFEWMNGNEPVIIVMLQLTNTPTEPKLPQTGEFPIWPFFTGGGIIAIVLGLYQLNKYVKSKNRNEARG